MKTNFPVLMLSQFEPVRRLKVNRTARRLAPSMFPIYPRCAALRWRRSAQVAQVSIPTRITP
jgi:hypothetical protein